MGTFTDDINDGLLDAIEGLGITVTFNKTVAAAAFNAGTMSRGATVTPYPGIKAMPDESRVAFTGKVTTEELLYTIRVSDLPGVTPDENDSIEDTIAGETYILPVVGVSRAAAGLVWKIRCRVAKATV